MPLKRRLGESMERKQPETISSGIKRLLKIAGILITAFLILCFIVGLFSDEGAIDTNDSPSPSTESKDVQAENKRPIDRHDTPDILTPVETEQPTASEKEASIKTPSAKESEPQKTESETPTPTEETGQPQVDTSNNAEPDAQNNAGSYDMIIQSIQDNLGYLTSEEQIDLDKVREDYKLLLSLYINEYVFKSYAYGYFTENFETDKFDYLIMQSKEVALEMKQYIAEDEVDEWFMECVTIADRSFDWSRFDYDSILIGDSSNPDVDAMWEKYITTSLT